MTSRRRPVPGARARRPEGARLGDPRWLVIPILVFFASVALAIHVVYERRAPARLEPSPPAPPQGAVQEPRLANAAAPNPPAPVAAAPAEDRERAVSDCVERIVKVAGADEAEAQRRGRWPAIKKAREQQRQRRIAARTACERT